MIRSCLVPLVAAFTLGLPACGADGSNAATLDAIQKTAADWTQMRVETQKLRSDWEGERAMLQSAQVGLHARLAELQQRKSTVEAETAAARGEVDTLRTRNAAASTSLAEAESRINALAAELTRLRAWMPPRLSHAVELSYRTLADEQRSPGERAQAMAAILGRAVQFNRSVTFSEEVLTGGADAEPDRVCEVIYWGMAEAYALDRARNRAFLGRPGANGWSWEARPDALEAVRRLIGTYRSPSEPDFAIVPAQVAEIAKPEVLP